MMSELPTTISASETKHAAAGELPDVYSQLFKLQLEAAAKVKLPALNIDTSAIAERAALGRPLLRFDEIAIDWELFRELFGKALGILGLAQPCADVQHLARDWYEGGVLAAAGADRERIALAVHAALDPFLAACHETLIKAIGREESRRHYCLICGEPPSVTFVDPARGERWLICCEPSWSREEIECSFCGNEEGIALVYFEDGDEQYRVYVCERCKRYLKSVNPRRCATNGLPTVERPFTLGMDLRLRELARREGPPHERPTASASPDAAVPA